MSRTAIKQRYIALAKETHPDSNNYASSAATTTTTNNNSSSSVNRFNEIAQAWTILSDAKTRRAYDRELAANDFKEDIVKKAGEVAREYGPTARKFYDDFAIPLLRRTTATTLAGWSAVTDSSAEGGGGQQHQQESGGRSSNGGGRNGNGKANSSYKLSGVTTLTDVVKEVSQMERSNVGGGGDNALEDFGKAFQRVIEAGRNATRQIDGMELQEKSLELRGRADETRAESMEILEHLTEIKSERLRLTFHTSSANFTSTDAIQYLEGFDQGVISDAVTLLQRMTFKHPVRQDIEAFTAAESEFDTKLQEYSEVEQEMLVRQRALQEAESAAISATQAEERARKMLEEAQRQVAESQRIVTEAQKSMRDLDGTVRKADYELAKANTMLKRKRDIVRRELKRKADKVEGPMFDQVENGEVRLNPGFDKSSMHAMGFEEQSLAAIEALRKDEQRVEGDFLQLVDKASRLVSRSERLMLRSQELIGEQQQMEKDAQRRI